MSCNCINEKEKFIREQLSSQNEEWKDRKVIDVSIENGMWLFRNRGRRVFSPITIEYETKNNQQY